MSIWESIGEWASKLAELPGPGKFSAAGKAIACQHCGHDVFIEGSTVLDALAQTHPGVDFGKSATALICDECGRIEFFAAHPRREP